MSEPDYSIFLPRRITQSGCTVAGTQLATYHAGLKAELKDLKVKLSAKVETAVTAVFEATKALEALPSMDATMNEIDRGSDRGVAGFDDQLEAIERGFDHASVLPLTTQESARLADATHVRNAVVPRGTAFLKWVYTRQWAQMSAMTKALNEKDVVAAVGRLGLTLEAARLGKWTELYGAKLGLTERKQADPSVVGVQAWHDAYGELFAHVHSEYNNKKDDAHAKVRDALLAPYLNQADEERRVDQMAKTKRKPSETPENEPT